ESETLLEQVTEKLGLSARSYTRILKVARTIADLAGSSDIASCHLAESIQYRCADRAVT
nr:ATP-dependent protease [Desulfuromonadales bacterium]NIS43656.1 ATP-dependent protease [Desulfuromonadales bacterium]